MGLPLNRITLEPFNFLFLFFLSCVESVLALFLSFSLYQVLGNVPETYCQEMVKCWVASMKNLCHFTIFYKLGKFMKPKCDYGGACGSIYA